MNDGGYDTWEPNFDRCDAALREAGAVAQPPGLLVPGLGVLADDFIEPYMADLWITDFEAYRDKKWGAMAQACRTRGAVAAALAERRRQDGEAEVCAVSASRRHGGRAE